MDRLRPRQRHRLVFSRFRKAEIEKMEKLFMESRELMLSKEFCQKLARRFSSSSGRAGKPIVKWTEVQSWFVARQQESISNVPSFTGVGEKIPDLSELEFEARSSKDGAWYDVDMFLTHRFLSPGEAAVREQSVPFEHSECNNVTVGDLVLCLQERRDQSIYFGARVIRD